MEHFVNLVSIASIHSLAVLPEITSLRVDQAGVCSENDYQALLSSRSGKINLVHNEFCFNAFCHKIFYRSHQFFIVLVIS